MPAIGFPAANSLILTLEQLLEDVRYAIRITRRQPAFSTVVVLILALGIGMNTAMFSLFDAVMLRLLPVRDPQQLYTLRETEGVEALSFPMFQRFREALKDTADLIALTRPATFYTKLGTGAVEPVTGQLVSGEFFPVLGVRPALGRLLTRDDNTSLGQHPVLIISYSYWQRRFNRDPGILGSVLPVNGNAFTIAGVAEAGFFGVSVGESPDVWLPLLMQAEIRYAQNAWASNADTRKPWPPQEGIRWLEAIVRVPDTRSVGAVQEAVNVLYRQDMERAGQHRNDRERSLLLRRRLFLEQGGQGFSTVRRGFAAPLSVLMTMVGLVLLIACANLANLLLARSMARRKEIAIRLSVGASRRRLVRQLLTESVVLAFSGGIVGLVLVFWSNRALAKLFLINVDLELDLRPFAFTAALSLMTGILFGLAPAFRLTRVDPGAALKSAGTAGAPPRQLALAKTLLMVQVSLSLVLITGAGLLSRTVSNLLEMDMGFDREHVLTARIDARSAGFTAAQLPALYSQLAERVRALPGVRSATIALSSIAGGGTRSSSINVPGYTPGPQENMSVDENFVDPGYFETVGTPVVEGRDFVPRDTETAPKVAVINETMARRFFGSRPIGRRYGYGGEQFEVVGVVRDARLRGPRSSIRPTAYRPIRQELDYAQSFEVRTQAEPRFIVSQLRGIIAEVAPNLPVQDIATVDERVKRLLLRDRLIAKLMAVFAAAALLLACIGIYGLISYAVSRRTAEMGLRLALGAQAGSVTWLVLREALLLVLVGIAAGIPLVFFAARLIEGLLFGVAPADPATVATAGVLMLCTATVAAYVPAKRASRLDPIAALRHE